MNKLSKQRVERALRQSKVIGHLNKTDTRTPPFKATQGHIRATFVRG